MRQPSALHFAGALKSGSPQCVARFLHRRTARANSRASHAASSVFSPMRIVLLLAALVAFVSAGVRAAEAQESSRYDRSQARSLTPEEAKVFGPNSDKYRYDSR